MKAHQRVCGKFFILFRFDFKVIQIFILVVGGAAPTKKLKQVTSEVVDGKFFYFFRFDVKVIPTIIIVAGGATSTPKPKEDASEVVNGKFLIRIQ